MTGFVEYTQLESITRKGDGPIVGCFTFLLSSVFCFGILGRLGDLLWHCIIGQIVFGVLAAIGLLLYVLIVASAVECLRFTRTDDLGISSGLFCRVYLRWSEVVEGARQGKYIRFRTPKRTIKVLVGSDYELEASILQHLAHFGVARPEAFSDQARSYWYAVPRAIPEEINWIPSRPVSPEMTALHVTNDGIVATYPGSTHGLMRSELADATWYYDEDLPVGPMPCLGLTGQNPLVDSEEMAMRYDVLVPFVESDADNLRCILAAIRQVRTAIPGLPVEIPSQVMDAVRRLLPEAEWPTMVD